MKRKCIGILLTLVLFAAGCAPGVNQADVDMVVQATFQALTASAELAPTQMPEPGDPAPPEPETGGADQAATGSIAGVVGYPAESIPELIVVAFSADSDRYYYTFTNGAFQIDNLPAGVYHVVAYSEGAPDFGGGYSQSVPCGLSVECTDHSLIPVTVVGGQITSGVEARDWYAGPGAFPLNPVP
jgi:hypothetical protein